MFEENQLHPWLLSRAKTRCFLHVVIRSAIVILFTLFIGLWATNAHAVDQGPISETKRPFRENVTLPLDSNLLKQFGTVEELLADQRWTEAIRMLQEISQNENRSLVLVQPGKAGGVAQYLNVAARCNVLLSRISSDGRIAYRKSVDTLAKRWFENWLRTHDEAELVRIVRQAFLSSFGDDALLALGESAWDRGNYSTARMWWEQLIPLPESVDPNDYPTVLRYPDSEIDRPSILARLILCSIMENEHTRAASEIRQFSEQFPVAEGWIAGQRGRLAGILLQLLNEAKNWTLKQFANEVATFALSPERSRQIPTSIDVGAFRWSQPLPPNTLPYKKNGILFPSESLSYHPVVYDNFVLVNDSNSIRAWNIASGEPAWQTEGSDPSVIYPPVPDEQKIISIHDCVGAPHYTMTIDDGRLFARMGSAVSCSSSNELRTDYPSELICLDLTQEGKLVWKISANELVPEAVPWRFEGTPIIVAGRAYVVLCRRNPQLELTVVCLDAADGHLRWQRPIGTFRNSVDQIYNRVSHLLLTAGGGRIFLSTDVGAIVALDGLDGRLEWAVTYESEPYESIVSSSDLSRKSLHPALFHAGLLFVAPSDAACAFCVEADSGRIKRQFSYLDQTPIAVPESQRRRIDAQQILQKQWRHLFGVVPGGRSGRLIVTGNLLWSIDVENGNVVFERPLGQKGTKEFGRGLIAGNQILVPLRESIEIYDLNTGDHLRKVLLKTPDSVQIGGNLTLANGMLLVAQPNRLVAYGEFSRLKQSIEDRLIQREYDSKKLFQIADLDRVQGSIDTAISGYQRVLENLNPDDPEFATIRRQMTLSFQAASATKRREGNLCESRDILQNAMTVVDDPQKRVAIILELARIEEGLNDSQAAIIQLSSILDRERLSEVTLKTSTAREIAIREITRLINVHGRDIYLPIETTANSEFESLKAANDRVAIRCCVNRFPHSAAAAEARQLLVQQYRQAGETSEALAVLNDVRRMTTDSQSATETALQIIELHEAAGNLSSAKELWMGLAKHSPSVEVMFNGVKHDLVTLARTQLDKVAASTRPCASFLERTWSHTLQPGSRIIVPEGKPLTAARQIVLICTKHETQPNIWLWQSLDWQSGRMLWEETNTSPIQLAGWTSAHLLIGTSRGWHARSANEGRHIWDQISTEEGNPLFTRPIAQSDDGFDWPATFDIRRGLRLFDPIDGRINAQLRPPGQLRRTVDVGLSPFRSDRVDVFTKTNVNPSALAEVDRNQRRTTSVFNRFLQTENPTRLWKISKSPTDNQWSIEEAENAAEAWNGGLFNLGLRLIGMNSERQLVGLDFKETSVNHSQVTNIKAVDWLHRWDDRNLAFGLCDPVVFTDGGKLFAIVDGSLVVSFDPETGTRRWSSGLAKFPLNHPAEQVCVVDNHIVATSQGVFRSVSLNDGTVSTTQFLGDISPQWRTTVVWTDSVLNSNMPSIRDPECCNTLVAVWPCDQVESRHHVIRICNPRTGNVLQTVRVEAQPRELMLDHRGCGLLWTDKSLSGLCFSKAISAVESTSITNPKTNTGAVKNESN